jgi:TolA-binding protein
MSSEIINILKDMFQYEEDILLEIYKNNNSDLEQTINTILEMNKIDELNKTISQLNLQEENKKKEEENSKFIELLTSVSNPLQN